MEYLPPPQPEKKLSSIVELSRNVRISLALLLRCTVLVTREEILANSYLHKMFISATEKRRQQGI